MIVTIQPSVISGIIKAPASKSSMQRACAAALLSSGTTTILNPGISNDDIAALDVIVKLGASITSQSDDKIQVKSDRVNPVSSEINCGESGLGIRMFTPIAALSEKQLTINGTGSLLTRPMHFFDAIFPKLGIEIKSNGGKLPITIKGPLIPADIEIDGSLSSQFLTGLLMAYAAARANGVTITVNNLKSKPYIDLTLEVMKQFGVFVANDNYERFSFELITPALQASDGISPEDFIVHNYNYDTGFHSGTYTVEGDWSGGAFLLVAGAIAGNITIEGLSVKSSQADKAILLALNDAAATINSTEDKIKISSTGLKAFNFDATDCPDLFPPLVALAAHCAGNSTITGVSRLAHKESNRGITLQEEFAKLGVVIDLNGDAMTVHGGAVIKAASVHSHHDHRIAMACAVAGLKAQGPITIDGAEAIDKSYPEFYKDLKKLGAVVSYS
ncbi:MAG: 3-phosphoshikimate 1-carboxyvinyltransferase [Flavitalea sp.]